MSTTARYDPRRATRQDVAAVSALFSAAFVRCTPADLLPYLSSPTSRCVLAHDGDGALVGAVLGVVRDSALELLPSGNDEVADRLGLAGPVGSVQYVCVAPGARRHGVGAQLVVAVIEWFHHRQVGGFLAEAWRYPDGSVPAGGLLERAGMRVGATVEAGFWREDSIALEYSCTQCRDPCGCGAVVYVGGDPR